jgi:hypothetical protein
VLTGTLDVAALLDKIAAVEVLLGYNTDYFTATSLGLEDDWDVQLAGNIPNNSGVIGKLDAAIGLSFDFSDPGGTAAAQTIADVALQGQGLEGETVFFHRVKLAGDSFGGDTRLTSGGGAATPFVHVSPFTANSGLITTDGSLPVINVASANATRCRPTSRCRWTCSTRVRRCRRPTCSATAATRWCSPSPPRTPGWRGWSSTRAAARSAPT